MQRRTFAIISHPDAGKTTLTEKLLLFGGAIQVAGAVKAKKAEKSVRSDWMEIERQRGISVATSVMSFEHEGAMINLLDTPGHKDFSEDTYRTLTAVDSALMVLDAAKGIEERTRDLFEVCRLRDTPIVTFINKMDRDARDPFELLDDIEQTLALHTAPVTWPIGSGQRFRGCYDLISDTLHLFSAEYGDRIVEGTKLQGTDDPKLDELIPAADLKTFREQIEMVKGVCHKFDHKSYLEGHLTPVFFGSAINNFGIRELLGAIAKYAPAPRSQPAVSRAVTPDEKKFSGFVFKIQANMDKNHRDRIAFLRICSGKYERGMKVLHVRSGKTLALNNPVMFMARDREVAEEAFPGDIIGIPNHGNLRIGDALTEGEEIHFTGIPSFAPEVFRRARLDDPMRSKQLKKALEELCEEGASQLFKPIIGTNWIIGVVGALQFDVLAARLLAEYGVKGGFEEVPYKTARWIKCADKETVKKFTDANQLNMAFDAGGALTYLAPNEWHLDRVKKDWPGIDFSKVRESV